MLTVFAGMPKAPVRLSGHLQLDSPGNEDSPRTASSRKHEQTPAHAREAVKLEVCSQQASA